MNHSTHRHNFAAALAALADRSDPDGAAVVQHLAAAFAVSRSGVAKASTPAPITHPLREPVAPIWSRIAGDPLTGASPVSVPLVTTTTGLAGAHTEGTEPTAGALTATGQNLQPSGVFGRVDVNREAFDAAGDRLANILWQEMQVAYLAGLEGKAATMLAALTPAATIAATGTGTALVSGILTAVAAVQLPTGAGVVEPRVLFAGTTLAPALIGAVDSSGRLLLPELLSALSALNVELVPAPALGTASWLVRPQDLGGWATPPQRLDLEYQLRQVIIGVIGYALAACIRPGSPRKVTYTP